MVKNLIYIHQIIKKIMGGSKNKSPAQKEKSQGKNKDAKKDKKKNQENKQEIKIAINEDDAAKIIKNSKMITIFDLAKQTNVKISTANNYLIKLFEKGSVKRYGGFSGHHVYQPISE